MEMAGAKALLRSAQYTPLITVAQHTARLSIARNAIQSSYCPLQNARHFSTTIFVCQQSAAAKEADNAEDTPPPQPREPDQRITMAARHQREARTSASKRREPLKFLANARHTSDAVAPPPSASSTTSPLISTDRNPSDTFLKENADNPSLDFLVKPRVNAQQQRTSHPLRSSASSSLDSIKGLLEAINTPFQPRAQSSRSAMDVSRILIPGQPNRPEGYDPTFPDVPKVKLAATAPPTFRISPSLGRTVVVEPSRNIDVARAFRMVEMKCIANSVKSDLFKQRFHERPGIKRKRLVMSRWRRRFKEAFKATVSRVQDMKRKGW